LVVQFAFLMSSSTRLRLLYLLGKHSPHSFMNRNEALTAASERMILLLLHRESEMQHKTL